MKNVKYKTFKARTRFISVKKFLETLKGRRDYKNHQLIYREDFFTTPRIEQNAAILTGYINYITQNLMKGLYSLYEEVSQCYENIKQIDDRKDESDNKQKSSIDKICEARRIRNDKKKRAEMILKMASYKEKICIFDEEYKHELEQICAVENAKLDAYWAGVLKAAKNSNLGEHRNIEPIHNPGLELYESHKEKILNLINEVLQNKGGDRDVLE